MDDDDDPSNNHHDHQQDDDKNNCDHHQQQRQQQDQDDGVCGDRIASGMYIIMRKTFDVNSCKLIKLGNEKYFYFYKTRMNTDSLLGQKFGSTFELTNEKSLQLVDVSQLNYAGEWNNYDGTEIMRDNRFIKDNNLSQKLSRDDIEKIKRETGSGRQVIQSLIENSATFEEKNAFAQEKYRQKKQQKYMNLYTVLKPTIKFLMEMYYAQGPGKNNYLRLDSLSQLLTLSNIMYGGRYLVVDSNLGILSAAILEKTDGNCSIIQIDTGNNCNGSQRQAVYALNYPPATVEQCLTCISIGHVVRLAEQKELKERKNKRLQMEEERARTMLAQGDLDSLLIMSKSHDPYSLAEVLLPFLALSRPFVIFCPSIEPLKECFVRLKGKCVYMRLYETWLRRYQVLPDRTRPEMMMNACSGFILTGIKVEHNNNS